MPVLKVAEEKVGPSTVLNVWVGLNDEPVFPSICPCCAEPSEEGATHAALCKELPPMVFPACKICARHLALEDRIGSVLGPGMLYLTLLTVAGFFVYRGAHGVAQIGPNAGPGWQGLGVLLALQFPFMSPINAGVTLLGAFAVFLVYLFIYWLLMSPLFWFLSKRSCKWFNQAARTSRSATADGPCRLLIFENLDYAAIFIKANTPA